MSFKHGSSGKPVTAMLEITERSTDQGNVFNVKVGCGSAVPLVHGSLNSMLVSLKSIHHMTVYFCKYRGNNSEMPHALALHLAYAYALQVAPIHDSADKEWNCLSLTVTQDGIITSHTGRLALFGMEKEVRDA